MPILFSIHSLFLSPSSFPYRMALPLWQLVLLGWVDICLHGKYFLWVLTSVVYTYELLPLEAIILCFFLNVEHKQQKYFLSGDKIWGFL